MILRDRKVAGSPVSPISPYAPPEPHSASTVWGIHVEHSGERQSTMSTHQQMRETTKTKIIPAKHPNSCQKRNPSGNLNGTGMGTSTRTLMGTWMETEWEPDLTGNLDGNLNKSQNRTLDGTRMGI